MTRKKPNIIVKYSPRQLVRTFPAILNTWEGRYNYLKLINEDTETQRTCPMSKLEFKIQESLLDQELQGA